MSKVIVNQLQNSTGGSPTLTWMTADGTSGQTIKSSDGSGTLAFTSDAVPVKTQDGNETLNFPNTISADSLAFKTDGSGNLTTFNATNPFSVDGSAPKETGLRLCDRVNISQETPAAQFTLTVPTAYTTDLSQILGFEIRTHGLRSAAQTTWNWGYQLTDQSGTILGAPGAERIGIIYFGAQSGQYGTTQKMPSTSDKIRPNVYPIYSNADNPTTSIFDNTTALTNWTPAGQLGYNKTIIYNAHTNKTYLSESHIKYNSSLDQSQMELAYGQLANCAGHIGGIKVEDTSGTNLVDGLVELYAHFKNGIDV